LKGIENHPLFSFRKEGSDVALKSRDVFL
jgi:hypothetical protein